MLYIYLVVLEHAVSSVLLREVDAEQRPIYLVSKTFIDCQTRYLPLEKIGVGLSFTFAETHALLLNTSHRHIHRVFAQKYVIQSRPF